MISLADKPDLHHIGIVQPSEEDAIQLMTLLGLEEDFRGYVAAWGALCIFTRRGNGSPIELIVPDEGSNLAKFNRGAGGLHHVALTVPSLDGLARRLAAEGMSLLESAHVRGAGPFLCNFLSPSYTRGLIIEFVEILPG